MGYDLLSNRGGYYRANNEVFTKLLQLAYKYNWLPRGTQMFTGLDYGYNEEDVKRWTLQVIKDIQPPPHPIEVAIKTMYITGRATAQARYQSLQTNKLKQVKNWRGAYLVNEFQTVIKEDASAMGEALSLAMEDIPVINIAEAVKVFEEDINAIEQNFGGINEGDINELLKFFSSEERKHKIKTFIKFCKASGGFEII